MDGRCQRSPFHDNGDGRDENGGELKNGEQRQKTNGCVKGRRNGEWRTKDRKKEGRTKRVDGRQNTEEETKLISIFNQTD